MKIACDNQVPLKYIQSLNKSGFEVVFRAQDEADEDWVRQAISLDAQIFISPDLDIPNLIQEYPDTFWVDYKNPMRKAFNKLMTKLHLIKRYYTLLVVLRRMNDK